MGKIRELNLKNGVKLPKELVQCNVWDRIKVKIQKIKNSQGDKTKDTFLWWWMRKVDTNQQNDRPSTLN